MNRRDFLKLSALFTGAAATLPFMRIEDEMQLSDVWLKMANQQSLTSEEKDFLHRMGDETQQRNQFVAGNTTPAGNLAINFPFAIIYSEVLQTTVASLTIQVPQNYKHLMLFAYGRGSEAGATSTTLLLQINGDTGANYDSGYVASFNAASVGGSQISGSSSAPLGVFSAANASAGSASGCVAYFPHYTSSFWKPILSFEGTENYSASGYGENAFRRVMWKNTGAIQSVKIYLISGNIVAGSVVSVYGLL